MSILSRFRRPTEPAAPLTEADKQAAPGQHFAPASAPDRANLTVRRAPSLPAFAITGLLIGLVVAFVVTALGPENPNYTFNAIFGVMAVLFGTLCTAAAIVVALILDKRSTKHTTTYQAVSSQD
ncbi:MAG: hypothetical protein Q4A03_03860 [Rothia sp. (in: high G+C Gram-positive bacteria)]|uniref:hypothetical protein n=1 Tax=Rothia sp. (in: high G+C Gram-positive bacteria) TaxID=1885016 RepID=UPI002706D909|nr:hypothetical protein [Rothia sp. (in: high G+C Gram-positive bacteria)]